MCLPLFLIGAPCASAEPPVRVTFQADQVGKFPDGWVSRNVGPGQVYIVQAEGGRRFLRGAAQDASVQIGYGKRWPLKEYPVLQWQWRAVLFPDGSDERKKSGADSVLGLYVVFGRWPLIKSIKYVWSDTVPVGESFDSPFSSRTKIVVIRSGRTQVGSWITERRDVLSDYRRLFGKDTGSPVARGIAILTDSDNTHSLAVGDYGDVETLPAAREPAALSE